MKKISIRLTGDEQIQLWESKINKFKGPATFLFLWSLSFWNKKTVVVASQLVSPDSSRTRVVLPHLPEDELFCSCDWVLPAHWKQNRPTGWPYPQAGPAKSQNITNYQRNNCRPTSEMTQIQKNIIIIKQMKNSRRKKKVAHSKKKKGKEKDSQIITVIFLLNKMAMNLFYMTEIPVSPF